MQYKIISKKKCYQGFFSLNKYQLQHQSYDGRWTEMIEREVFERGDAVCVLPYDPLLQTVVLIEQFRAGAIHSKDPWLLETIAGMIADGEDTKQTASRELKEECGLDSSNLYYIGQYYSSPGGCSEKLSIYCAFVDSTQALDFAGLEEENEDIRVLKLSLNAVRTALKENTIKVAPTALALYWLLNNHNRLI